MNKKRLPTFFILSVILIFYAITVLKNDPIKSSVVNNDDEVQTPDIVFDWNNCHDDNSDTICLSIYHSDNSSIMGTCRVTVVTHSGQTVNGWENDCSILRDGHIEFRNSEFDTDGQFYAQDVFLEIRNEAGWENAQQVPIISLVH